MFVVVLVLVVLVEVCSGGDGIPVLVVVVVVFLKKGVLYRLCGPWQPILATVPSAICAPSGRNNQNGEQTTHWPGPRSLLGWVFPGESLVIETTQHTYPRPLAHTPPSDPQDTEIPQKEPETPKTQPTRNKGHPP